MTECPRCAHDRAQRWWVYLSDTRTVLTSCGSRVRHRHSLSSYSVEVKAGCASWSDEGSGTSFLAMPGESLHEVGRDGAIRAKRWLEATTRVDVPWVNPDHVAKLSFPWIGKGTFSFDLGGTLRGGDVHGQEFFAEVKRYTNASDQGSLYREYLAKCYCAYQCSPARCDHFMWITWHPFSVTRWTRLCTAKEVEDAVRGE